MLVEVVYNDCVLKLGKQIVEYEFDSFGNFVYLLMVGICSGPWVVCRLSMMRLFKLYLVDDYRLRNGS